MGTQTQDVTVRRAAVIGDVHGEDATLEAVLAFLSTVPDLDVLLCTGDIPAKQDGGDTARCCDLLAGAGVLTVRGNHDRWYFEDEPIRKTLPFAADRFLHGLPPTRAFDTPHGPLLLCHGLGDDDMTGIYPGGDDEQAAAGLWRHELTRERVRFVVNGHTHERMVRKLEGVTILNAGTLLWDHDPCFFIADFDALTVQFYNVTPFTHAIAEGERVALT